MNYKSQRQQSNLLQEKYLPNELNQVAIDNYVISVHEKIVKGEIK